MALKVPVPYNCLSNLYVLFSSVAEEVSVDRKLLVEWCILANWAFSQISRSLEKGAVLAVWWVEREKINKDLMPRALQVLWDLGG